MYKNDMNSGWEWKHLYSWTMCGPWRKWCIPGAILGLLAFIFLNLLLVLFKDSPDKKQMVFSVCGFIFRPLSFIYNSDFIRRNELTFVFLVVSFVVYGIIAGLCGKMLCVFLQSAIPSQSKKHKRKAS